MRKIKVKKNFSFHKQKKQVVQIIFLDRKKGYSWLFQFHLLHFLHVQFLILSFIKNFLNKLNI